MTYWNWGVNFNANPKSHYRFMLRNEIVIGWQPDTPYQRGDLVAITKGMGLLAIAHIDEAPQPITANPLFHDLELRYGIWYQPNTIFAAATIHEVFPYQSGGCAVNEDFHQGTMQLLWNRFASRA